MWSKQLDYSGMSFYGKQMLQNHIINNYNKSIIVGKYRDSKVNIHTIGGMNKLFDYYMASKNLNFSKNDF